MEQVTVKSDGGSSVAPRPQSGKRISAGSQYHRDLGPEFQRRGSSRKPDCGWGKGGGSPSFVLTHHRQLGKALLAGQLEAQSFKSDIQHPHQLWALGLLKSSKLVNLMERSQPLAAASGKDPRNLGSHPGGLTLAKPPLLGAQCLQLSEGGRLC